MDMFDVMSDADLVRWAGRFQRENQQRGAVIVNQGDASNAFYIVDQGELRASARVADQDVGRVFW
jgi:CRP-like cAMP-binding protein